MRKLFFIIFFFILTHTFAQNKTKNIIAISMDGYRWKELFGGADSALLFNKKYNSQDSAWRMQKYWADDATARREKLMPFVWNEIAKHGQIYGNRNFGNNVNVKNKYWFSYPGRSETFTGYYDPQLNSNDKINNPNENVLEFINKQKGYEDKVVAFASWDVVAWILNRDRNSLMVNIYGEDVKGPNLTPLQKEMNLMQYNMPDIMGQGERLDVMTYEMTKAYMMANHPRVVYIDFGDNDVFAHEGHYDLYLDAAHKIDAMISQLWRALQHDDFYKDQTAILIFTDHGRGEGKEWTSHGSGIAHANETFLMAIGPDIPALGEVKKKEQIYQDQFAQTIANLLGLDFRANHPVGKPVKTVLP